MSEVMQWFVVLVLARFGSSQSSVVQPLEVEASLSGYNIL
jgi:hypothetical protein